LTEVAARIWTKKLIVSLVEYLSNGCVDEVSTAPQIRLILASEVFLLGGWQGGGAPLSASIEEIAVVGRC